LAEFGATQRQRKGVVSKTAGTNHMDDRERLGRRGFVTTGWCYFIAWIATLLS
jgi:hypothetical protein